MKIKCLLILLTAVLMSSCYNQRPTTPDAWNLSDRQLDSISFYTTHHYTRNFNFIVASDSILLSSQSPDELPFDRIIDSYKDKILVGINKKQNNQLHVECKSFVFIMVAIQGKDCIKVNPCSDTAKSLFFRKPLPKDPLFPDWNLNNASSK